jgi:CheY-like chemotaxis protein
MKPNVLIVDDQRDIRKLILMTMESEDFNLYEAENGEDAWTMVQKLQPIITLIDVMMPGRLDGYQVCEKIKNDAVLEKRTKVILLTARGQSADIALGKAAGCDAYLVKPFSPLELLDLVDQLVATP